MCAEYGCVCALFSKQGTSLDFRGGRVGIWREGGAEEATAQVCVELGALAVYK